MASHLKNGKLIDEDIATSDLNADIKEEILTNPESQSTRQKNGLLKESDSKYHLDLSNSGFAKWLLLSEEQIKNAESSVQSLETHMGMESLLRPKPFRMPKEDHQVGNPSYEVNSLSKMSENGFKPDEPNQCNNLKCLESDDENSQAIKCQKSTQQPANENGKEASEDCVIDPTIQSAVGEGESRILKDVEIVQNNGKIMEDAQINSESIENMEDKDTILIQDNHLQESNENKLEDIETIISKLDVVEGTDNDNGISLDQFVKDIIDLAIAKIEIENHEGNFNCQFGILTEKSSSSIENDDKETIHAESEENHASKETGKEALNDFTENLLQETDIQRLELILPKDVFNNEENSIFVSDVAEKAQSDKNVIDMPTVDEESIKSNINTESPLSIEESELSKSFVGLLADESDNQINSEIAKNWTSSDNILPFFNPQDDKLVEKILSEPNGAKNAEENYISNSDDDAIVNGDNGDSGDNQLNNIFDPCIGIKITCDSANGEEDCLMAGTDEAFVLSFCNSIEDHDVVFAMDSINLQSCDQEENQEPVYNSNILIKVRASPNLDCSNLEKSGICKDKSLDNNGCNENKLQAKSDEIKIINDHENSDCQIEEVDLLSAKEELMESNDDKDEVDDRKFDSDQTLEELQKSLKEEQDRRKTIELEYHEKIDGLDKEIFTLQECVEVSENHAEDLQNQLVKERARTELLRCELKQQEAFWKDQVEQSRLKNESKVLELEQSQIELTRQRDQFDGELFKLKVIIDDKETALIRSEETNSKLRNDILELVANFGREKLESGKKLDKLRNEVKALKEKVKDKNCKISAMEKSNDEKRKLIAEKSTEINRLKSVMENLAKDFQEYQFIDQRCFTITKILQHIDNID